MTGHLEIRFPEDQQEGTEALMSKWLKAPGEDRCRPRTRCGKSKTDKVVVEIAAPADGTMGEIRVKEGDAANPGDILCTLITSTTGPAETEKAAAPIETPPAATPATMSPRLNGDGPYKIEPGRAQPVDEV